MASRCFPSFSTGPYDLFISPIRQVPELIEALSGIKRGAPGTETLQAWPSTPYHSLGLGDPGLSLMQTSRAALPAANREERGVSAGAGGGVSYVFTAQGTGHGRERPVPRTRRRSFCKGRQFATCNQTCSGQSPCTSHTTCVGSWPREAPPGCAYAGWAAPSPGKSHSCSTRGAVYVQPV